MPTELICFTCHQPIASDQEIDDLACGQRHSRTSDCIAASTEKLAATIDRVTEALRQITETASLATMRTIAARALRGEPDPEPVLMAVPEHLTATLRETGKGGGECY